MRQQLLVEGVDGDHVGLQHPAQASLSQLAALSLSIWLALCTSATDLAPTIAVSRVLQASCDGGRRGQVAGQVVDPRRRAGASRQVVDLVAVRHEGFRGGPADADAGAGDNCDVHNECL